MEFGDYLGQMLKAENSRISRISEIGEALQNCLVCLSFFLNHLFLPKFASCGSLFHLRVWLMRNSAIVIFSSKLLSEKGIFIYWSISLVDRFA